MLNESRNIPSGVQVPCTRLVHLRLAVLILLVAIAGFSTAAKNSQYYSRSHPAHYLSISSKMKMSAVPVTLDHAPLRLLERRIAPALETTRSRPAIQYDSPEVPALAITLTLQHRSPPTLVS